MTKSGDKIISVLSKYDRFVTSKELANTVGVSTKTIYRKISEINKNYQSPIIKSEPGKGYIIDYEQYLKTKGHDTKNSTSALQLTPLERRNEVMTVLLFNAPQAININDVYDKYFISYDLVKQDLLTIGKTLSKFHINLFRNGNQIKVEGKEQQIRKAINNALLQSKAMNTESINDFASEFKDLSHQDNQFLTTQIDWIQKSLHTTVPYPYNINIFSHLYVLIKRFRYGKVVKADEESNEFYDQYQQIINDNPKFWKISTDVVKNTADYIHREIPEIESYYLLEYLISMRYNHDFQLNDSISADSSELADFYIKGFKLDEGSSKTKSLKNDLISHIRPMYNRLKNHIVIVNKLLKDIRSEYSNIFNRLQKLSQQAYKTNLLPWPISSDEVGFLTLYFAKYYEEVSLNKKVLVMCASGVGTSKLLYAKIHRNFPNLDLVGITSKSDYEKDYDKYSDVDVIVSTVPVVAKNHAEVVLSSAMFNLQDRNRLSRYINEGFSG
ncbi:BglG family transcription antiterminator [Limosilactobacillus caecicola]|uniref:BglG family transcription antiterminator n=1 Tax=Limosilactobacillus caecicola TaxID=2941332 RepID=UPI00203C1E9B|nr:PRD domain-containing protein [Limosilactobacillus caecicola]